jgi:hypothetical protein
MDKKRAKIKLKEYLRKLDENTKDLPMSTEGSPTVTDTETGEVTYGRPRKYSLGGGLGLKNFIVEKFKSSNNTNQNYSLPEDNYFNDLIRVKPIKASTGKYIKDLIGPITLQPSGTKETTVEGKVTRDTKAGSLGVGTKLGNITLSKSNVTESMPGYSDYKTKSKGVSYDKIFDIGKSSKLAINLRKGKSESNFNDSKTEGATVTFTKTFGGPKMKTGGMCRGMGKAIRGGKFTGVK